MSTLSDQLNLANQRRIQKFNDAHYGWLMQFEPEFTHFITLTFNPTRIRDLINSVRSSKMIDRKELLGLQKRSFRCFSNCLNKSLFGNASERYGNKLLLVPILEGLFEGGRAHYHCVMGVPQDRFQAVEAKVREAWKQAPLSGHQVDVQPYRNSGCLGYVTKQAKYINRECIDWDNVLVPCTASQFPSIAE
jgi:hypothetical protein